MAETAIVAEHSKKSPRNLFVGSLNAGTLRVTPLHLILIDLMMALKIPNGCAGLKLLGTVKTSNTEQTLCTRNSAVPSSRSTFPLPTGKGVPQKTSEPAMNPGSYEWKPNGLPWGVAALTPKLSNHMNPMEPRCRSLSRPTKTPSMKRMSVWKS